MSIQFGDILKHNNLVYPIVDINDVKGGLRSIATFSSPALVSEYASIPEKYRSGYSLLLETSTGTIYYLAGLDATNKFHWSPVGIGGNGTGVANAIPKWTSSSILGNSNITDNGDTVTINGNLQVIGTTSTISSENLLVKDPIILLAGSQSGTPTYDAGLFVNRGSSDTQAFIWDESMTEFKFITTTSGATVSGDVSIGTYSSVRTGVLSVGTGTKANSRFLVSSSGGTVSLIVDEFGNVYNNGNGGIATNTAFGASALSKTAGYNNTAIGAFTLLSNTFGIYNTALGSDSLRLNTIGSRNTALGAFTLYSNLSGYSNTAVGNETLRLNTNGYNNTAIGVYALLVNTTGRDNTAIGVSPLASNTTGIVNTAIGNNALFLNTTGSDNTALGHSSMFYNTTGILNTAIGNYSLFLNTTGSDNTAIGIQSLSSNRLGSNNIAIGNSSLYNNTTGVELDTLTFSPGSGYVDGFYTNIDLVYATGSNDFTNIPIVNIEIFFGEVVYIETVYSGAGFSDTTTIFTINSYGIYTAGDGFEIGISGLLSGNNNIAVGINSLYNNTIGSSNTALGIDSLYSNISGNYNSALGYKSLFNNISGYNNVAVGQESLYNNTTGFNNNTLGYKSLFNNTSGYNNVAVGQESLYFNTTGSNNTANGFKSLFYNTIGSTNTAIGYQSLLQNTTTIGSLGVITPGSGYLPGTYSVTLIYATGSTILGNYPIVTIVVGVGGGVSSVTLITKGSGFKDSTTRMTVNNSSLGGVGSGFEIGIASLAVGSDNTAIGANVLYNNTTGLYNSGIGNYSLYSNTTGILNTAIGFYALSSNTTGYSNIGIGLYSLRINTTGYSNIGIGESSLFHNTTGDRNTAVGYRSMRYYKGLWSVGIGGGALTNISTGILTLSATFSPGNSYTPGTYSDVRLIYNGVGTFWNAPNFDGPEYPTAEIVVGPGGTVSSVTLKQRGVLIPDTTTRFTAQTGTQSYHLGTASGNGFDIGIATISTGSLNTALGYGSMYKLGVGSDNIAIGMWAGSSYGPTGSSFLTGADQSIFIGRFASALANDCINEIVIGNEARGNGSNTITLGNDSVIKTYLKGNIQLPTVPTTTSGGSYSILTRNDVTGEVEKVSPGNVIWYGQSGTVIPNAIHYLSGSGWTLADASTASAVGVLAIALGSNASDGMLLRGIYKASTTYYDSMTIGGIQFLSTTSGEFSETTPSATGEFVRIIGYCLLPDSGSGGTLYFSPDSTWVELS